VSRRYWLILQLAAIAAGIYGANILFDWVTT
jgi:hypothetical protein